MVDNRIDHVDAFERPEIFASAEFVSIENQNVLASFVARVYDDGDINSVRCKVFGFAESIKSGSVAG